MQGDPAAPPPIGGVVESCLGPDGQAAAAGPQVAACAGEDGAGVDWVPDREAEVVPDQARQLCGFCAGREACLLLAVAVDAEGYWAGTTTHDRAEMRATGAVSVAAATRLQVRAETQLASAAVADRARATHAPGEGGLRAYRRDGCRCAQCRRANADDRAEQRARARRRTTQAGAKPRDHAAE